MGGLSERTAQTPVASTVPEPHGKPGGGLWGHPGLMAPPYIEHVAGELMKQGHPESDAYHMAVGIVQNWAAGHDGKGNSVHPDVQAAAVKNIAQWEALKARYGGGKRFNPYHLPVGPGGGEFTGPGGGGGGGGKAASKTGGKPAAKAQPAATGKHPMHKPGESVARRRLLERAQADREKAKQLEAELRTLEAQLHQQAHQAAAAAHQSAAAAKTAKAQAHQKHKQAAQSKHQKAAAHKATHITSKHRKPSVHHSVKHRLTLQHRITQLKVQIAALLAHARQLEKQANGMRSLEVGAEFREGSAVVAQTRAAMSAADQNDLPDSAFAYVEPGGSKDSGGKTVPRSKRHFPIHDAAHVRNALSRAPQSPFGDKAMPAIKAAAKKFGIGMSDDSGRSLAVADTERRYTPGVIEVRAVADEGGFRIGGYGAVFGKLSRNLGGFVERVGDGAFNQSRSMGWPNVVCRYNHDANMVLGTTAGGTLQLRTDNVGLDYEVVPPMARADIVELVERRDIQFSSFAFRVPAGGDEWSTTDQNYPMRTLHEVQLVDVAPVLDPAYPDATAGLRSLAAHFSADPEEVRQMAEADELRRFFVRTDRPSYQPPKPKVSAAAAMMQLMEKRRDPFVGQG